MALTYDQISSITTKYYLPKLVDNIFDTNAVLKRLNRPNFLKLRTGGTSIVAPVINSKPSAGGYYSDNDALSSTPTDNMTAADFAWKQVYEPVKISRADLLKNAGDAQKLSLIESKMMIAETNIKENLAIGLFSDGTAATGALTTKQITGFRAIMSTSSTYGGIAVADFAEWIAAVKTNSGTACALTLNLMQNAEGAASFDGDLKPTAIFCKQNVYDQAWSLFQPHQRLMSAEMEKLGFENVLTFNGKPIIVDSHVLAASMYFVDENHTFLVVMKDENMRVQTMKELETSNAMLSHIFWMGNLACNSRRSNAYLGDIAVA